MDDLTPLEPEFLEIPPEQPPEQPNYYGTGVDPQKQKKSKLPLILTLLTILMAANLFTLALSFYFDRNPSESKPPQNEPLFPFLGGEVGQKNDKDKKGPPKDGDSFTLKEIYDYYTPGTVVVSSQSDYGVYCATGLILTHDGYILTDGQIVNPRNLYVTLPDGSVCDASLVGTEDGSEMAILKVNRQGLDTADLSEDVMSRALEVLQDILQNASQPASLNLDISEVPRTMQIYWGLPEGVIINRIATNSNAYRAGLRPGDVLLQIGQETITNASDYFEALKRYSAGETVRVYLYRNGTTYYADIHLDGNLY